MRARAAFAVAMLAACGRREPLPVYGEIQDFALTAESGDAFTRRSLDGQVWVANFIFTSCSGPCPRLSSLMRQVQASAPAVRLVSFTVDPERDTPAVLAEYAKKYGAQPGRWVFATGAQEVLHRIKRESFKLGSVDGSLNHSTRLVLVDGRGRIRGYYGTDEESPVRRLVADVKRLREES
ncbi:MAG: SCO family protein [Bryobacteraceae bacterium]